jgi:hypothetical protein
MRVLNLDKLQTPNDSEIPGTYTWSLRGHYASINLDSENSFRYEFSNSGNKGYRVGTYALSGNRLVLVSDSLFSISWADILVGKKDYSTSAVNSEYVFIMTEKGLHEKNLKGNFWKEPTYIKSP